MRKILSILLAVGLVLSMFVMTSPVSARVTQPAVTVLDTNCAGEIAAYNITFNVTAALHPGSNHIFVEFPAGTVVPAAGWFKGAIEIYGETHAAWADVFGSEVEVTGTTVKFMVPITIEDDDQVIVRFNKYPTFGIRNPSPGWYKLSVYTDRPQDATPRLSGWYQIVPAIASYKFALDFGDTYPGIAADFIPPFKACGQASNATTPWQTWQFEAGKWANNFTFTLSASPAGCYAPCANATVWFTVPEVELNSTTSFWVNGTKYTLSPDPGETAILDAFGDLDRFFLAPVPLSISGVSVTYNLSLHFDRIGDYEICFYAMCPQTVCSEAAIIAETCMPFKVHQWKDAYPITLYPKWNLVSLPLVPFDTSVASITASLGGWGPLAFRSVWHYDRCDDEWFAFGNGQTSLTDIEDGKSYWFRMLTPTEWNDALPTYAGAWNAASNATWWVFGTAKPMAPAGPAAYPVCEGWNMVGFLPPWEGVPALPVSQPDEGYLWNFFNFMDRPEYGIIYSWDASVQNWDTQLPEAEDLEPTKGYWITFSRDGTIYP